MSAHDTSFKVLIRPDKEKRDGSMPIYIRISKHRDSKYFSIGASCSVYEWNEKAQKLWESIPRITDRDLRTLSPDQIKERKILYSTVKVHPTAKQINVTIEDKLEHIKQVEKDLKINKQGVSVKKIRDKVIDTKPEDRSYLKFYLDRMENLIRKELAYNTYRAYLSAYNRLKKYQKGRDLSFEDIDDNYLDAYYITMLKEKYKPETIKKHFKWMQAIWKRAKKKRIVNTNPFEDFEIKAGDKVYKERLTVEHIKKLMNLELTGRMNDARNIFIFSFFHAGIRVGDSLKLKWEYIISDRVQYKMKKNDKKPDYKLNPIGKKILEFYKKDDQKDNDYVFGLLENNLDESTEYFERQIQSKTAILNKNLKKVALLAGLKINLTNHISRHSYGGIAIEENINAFDFSYTMMHSKVQTSDTYTGGANAKRMDKILDLVYKDFSEE